MLQNTKNKKKEWHYATKPIDLLKNSSSGLSGDLITGTTLIFRVYGLVCGVVLVLFFVLNFYNISEGKFTTDLPEDLDPRNVRVLIFFVDDI